MKDAYEFYNNTHILLELNKFIQTKHPNINYHMEHIKLVHRYAMILSRQLNNLNINSTKLSFAALAHDLFKEHGLNKIDDGKISWNGHNIPQDLNRYVRTHLDTLDIFGLTDFFNTDIQLHSLAAGIWLYEELNIDDPEILYPIFFHSCPIMEVYNTLDSNIQESIDIIMLADKLSSNYLKINLKESPVRIDLDLAIFGPSGREFNYSTGLLLARLVNEGRHPDKQSSATTESYLMKAKNINPLISYTRLGGKTIWPKRISQVLKKH